MFLRNDAEKGERNGLRLMLLAWANKKWGC